MILEFNTKKTVAAMSNLLMFDNQILLWCTVLVVDNDVMLAAVDLHGYKNSSALSCLAMRAGERTVIK